jgi:hypothetical protein
MYKTRAYSASNATSPLAAAIIPRRDPSNQAGAAGLNTIPGE